MNRQSCNSCKAPICISQISLFRNLTPKQRTLIISHVKRRSFKRKEIFLLENDLLDSFVIISGGKFKAYTNYIDGKQNVLYFFTVGDFFGQHALFESTRIPYTIEAMEDSSICLIESSTMHTLLEKEPGLAVSIVNALAARVSYLESELSSVNHEKIEIRLLRLLYELSKDYGKLTNDEIWMRLPLSQEEIAMRLGVSRESISRNFRKLIDDKTIRMPSRKEVFLPKM